MLYNFLPECNRSSSGSSLPVGTCLLFSVACYALIKAAQRAGDCIQANRGNLVQVQRHSLDYFSDCSSSVKAVD